MVGRQPKPVHDPSAPSRRGVLGRVSRLELAVAATAALVLAVLVVIEPDIVKAPVQNATTVGFTVGGTAVAALAFVVMVRLGVPPLARILVLGAPFVAVNWWLLSPFFMDSVADDDFDTTIAAAAAEPAPGTTQPVAPSGPVLLATGSFEGLAGHDGEGDAGLFRLPDGRQVLRFENFDIDNGPDLRLYVVPGADQRSIRPGSVSLGKLKGNVGDQTYDLPPQMPLTPGPWTVLVWCEAFSVEFVAATLDV